MNLRSNTRQNIQMELDFHSEPAGEARAGRKRPNRSRRYTRKPSQHESANGGGM